MSTPGGLVDKQELIDAQLDTAHLGRVVNSKDASGAPISTSTNRTGGVNKTLDALEGEYQADIDNFVQVSDQIIVDKTAEFDMSIANKETEADAAIDAYRLLSKGPYAAGILLEDKFQYITYNGESYFAVNPPYTTTATTPDTDGNLFAGGYLTSQQLSLYTDIVYKASGGNSAVENMLSEFNNNPLSHAVGSILSTGGTAWQYVDSTGPVTIDNFRAFNVLNVIDCGAVGDSVTDDYESITYAASIAKQKELTLFFPELLFYVSQSASLGDVKVYAERPAYSDPISALRPDGTNFINGSIGSDWSYYYNSTEEGRNTSWRTHLQSVSPGAAIISDVASPVITCVDGERFNLDGIGVIGNHRLQGQHGIGHPSSLEYKGNQHSINRVRVTGCGDNGIHLPKGWEASSSEGVISSQNNGYGIYVGVIESGGSVLDSATEHLSIKNTGTANNRLGGIYFEQYRKHLNIDGFHGNNNGQYNSATENGKIDPLLGYDRNIPPREQMASLIWINDVTRDSVGQTGTCQNLHFKNIWGEQVAKGIHIRAREGAGILRNVTFDDISLIRLSQLNGVPANDPANGCVIYWDVKYLADVDIGTIYPQSLYQLDVENVDFTENNIRALGWTPVTNKEFQFLHWKYEGTLGSFSFAAAVPIVREDFTAPAINTVQTSDIIKNTHTYYPSASTLAPFSKWRIYGQHQATNADYYGVYEMTVFRSNRGRWKGTANLVSVDDAGDSFTSPPTIAIDGTLSLPTRAFSMVRVEIMEGLTWIGGIDI
ncbi:hypothetical protein SIPHO062v1_p0037 [Vibrio phage PS17B.1]|nr:hypothetical protein SIPHO062v1_p0037 [Vibrio phage PS17B.1]